MSTPDPSAGLAGSGVEALIARLRQQGLESGRTEAQRIRRGRAQGCDHRPGGRCQGPGIPAPWRGEAERARATGDVALRVAKRDRVLKMEGYLSTRYSEEVRRLVAADMSQEAFLDRPVMEVLDGPGASLGWIRPPTGDAVPEGVVVLGELRPQVEEPREGSLSHCVLSPAKNVLHDGVSFGTAGDLTGRVRACLQEGEAPRWI
jgi:V/A-type H+-transporting ATPase subunit E